MICDDLATSCKNLVRFCPVTLEFKRVVSVHPFILKNHLKQITPGSTGSTFTKFSPYGRHFTVDKGSDLLFPITQGMLQWQPILVSKLAKSAYSSPWHSETDCNIALLILKGSSGYTE